MKVYFSTNCGESWQLRATISGTDLVNSGLEGDPYVPWSGSIWTEKQVSIPGNIQGSNNVRVKFQYISGGYGNNFYIDGITFENPSSVEELESQFGMSVYPNPSAGNTTLSFNMPATEKVKMHLMDITGRMIKTVYDGTLQQGNYKFNLDLQNLDAGLYLLNVNYRGEGFAKKVMVE